MEAVSEAFLDAVRQSGKRKTVVDVYYGTNTSPIMTDLPVVSGEIRYDRSSAVRASGSLVIGDPSLLMDLEPWGIEIVIRSGVVYPNGQEELVQMGVFMIDSESFEEAEGRIPTIEFFDRAQRVSEKSLFVSNPAFPGQLATDVLNALILSPAPGYPTAPLWALLYDEDSIVVNPRLPGGFYNGSVDRWAFVLQIADLLAGSEIFFQRDGDAILQIPPAITPTTTAADAVWTVDADQGDNTGVMISSSVKVSRENAYNGVLIRGSTPSKAGAKQVYGTAYDLDPNSRTYWYGPFGKKRYDTSNQALTTKAQCATAAAKMLKTFNGLSRTCSFGSLINPALSVGDIIEVVNLDGDSEVYMVETLQIPFGEGTMTGSTSSVQYSGGGG